MNKVKFAILGCGRIFKKHADAISSIQGAEIVAVCDKNIGRASDCGAKYGVPFYTDLSDMMRFHPEADIVSILTHSGDHANSALEVCRYQKHVLVEKPMCLSLSDADRMIYMCKEANVKLFVVKQNRYNLPVKKLRTAVESGKFGKLVLGTVRVRWCRTQEYYDQDAWRGTWRDDGGVFTNQASHHIDLLEWMMGEVESVFAKASTRLANIEVEDTGVALLRFKNGALGVIEATTATRPKDLEGSISILGEKGTVEIGGFAVNKLKTWQFLGDDNEAVENFSSNPPDIYGFGHQEYIQDVVNCIQLNHEPVVSGVDGRRSLELIHAIYESIETGKEVFLGFSPNTYADNDIGAFGSLRFKPISSKLGSQPLE